MLNGIERDVTVLNVSLCHVLVRKLIVLDVKIFVLLKNYSSSKNDSNLRLTIAHKREQCTPAV